MSENSRTVCPQCAIVDSMNRNPKRERPLFRKTMKSPVGMLTLLASDAGLAAIRWEQAEPHEVFAATEAPHHPTLVEVERQLGEYFAGSRKEFSVTLAAEGTGFQKEVWQALTTIPFGKTRSYGELARQIGRPNAVRAVGAANGRNPIPIIVPCHRVIGANGTLTGFAGGLDNKRKLLWHEAQAQ